ncbi:class I SAM-dependent methyltransferase [Pelobacter propionicus]|nr:SAM-dependent methyltransferase [Pelobacter propionicus]
MARRQGTSAKKAGKEPAPPEKHDIRPGQSLELLQELHILTRDGKLNQDSRRKLKQINHLYQFIEPLLEDVRRANRSITLVDHGAGKSYLGFILYDLYVRQNREAECRIFGIETRDELVDKSRDLARRLGFDAKSFLNLSVADAIHADAIPQQVDMVTALHACDTATDDAIRFALMKRARFVVLAPCCQAEVAAVLRRNKGKALASSLAELWRRPLHTREFGSLVTNVLRCLQLEAHGYQVNVTELVGWEHSLKNELIMAEYKDLPRRKPAQRLNDLLRMLGVEEELGSRFFTPPEERLIRNEP